MHTYSKMLQVHYKYIHIQKCYKKQSAVVYHAGINYYKDVKIFPQTYIQKCLYTDKHMHRYTWIYNDVEIRTNTCIKYINNFLLNFRF